MVPLLPNLRYFYYDDDIEAPLLLHLSTSPKLKSLEFENVAGPFPQFGPRGFPALESLKFGEDIDRISQLLSHITSSGPHALCISPTQPRTFNITRLAYIVKTCLSRTLRHFTLQWVSCDTSPDPLDKAVFSPLYECHQLEVVHLGVYGYSLEFNDQDIETMGNAWPRLRSLAVAQGNAGDSRRPQATLYGLRSLATLCTQLDSIQIAVDALVSAPCTDLAGAGASRLRNLNLEASPCGNVDFVVDFLRRAFPHLRRLEAKKWAGEAPEEEVGLWSSVKRQIGVLGNKWG
jgi:hypothetical protein